MDALWLALAFLLGLLARQLGLPALVGYLVAGFALNALGQQSSGLLDQVAHAGVLLLLFSVGLKLKLQSLIRPDVWGGGGPVSYTHLDVYKRQGHAMDRGVIHLMDACCVRNNVRSLLPG